MGKEKKKKVDDQREIRQILDDMICSKDEEKAHFEELYTFFKESKWRKLKTWNRKNIFFKHWFTAISNEYTKCCQYFESIKKNPLSQNKELNLAEYVALLQEDDRDLFLSCMYNWSLPPSKNWRCVYLLPKGKKNYLKKPIVWAPENNKIEQFYKKPPYIKINVEELSNQVPEQFIHSEAVKIIFVDVRYPVNTILEETEKIIRKEQIKYYAIRPSEVQLFIKGSQYAKKAIYPYNEWERYLKVYMLKKLGKTTNEVGEQFYKDNEDPGSQVRRDMRKAKKLCKSAIAGNFPG